MGTASVEYQAKTIENVLVGGILFVLDNESFLFLSDFFRSVMKTHQLMLSIPPERLLEVANSLGISYDVPLVDDADLELVVKLLDALLSHSLITFL